MAVEVPQNKEISERGKNGGEKDLVLLTVKDEQIGEAYVLRKKARSCIVRFCPLHNQSRGQAKREGR